MTKQRVTILILLMAVALTGIMALQFIWMQKAYIVRNELFDRSVNEALIRSVNRMEMFSDVFLVHDMMTPPPPPSATGRNLPMNKLPIHRFGISQGQPDENDTIDLPLRNEKLQRQGSAQIIRKMHTTQEHQFSFEVKVDSLMQNIGEQIDHNITIMYGNRMSDQIPDSMEEFFPEWNRKVGKRVEQLKNVAGQMFLESWAWNSNMLPDTAMLCSLLNEELVLRNIPISYEFALSSPEKMLTKSINYDTLQITRQTYTIPLYPNAIFNNRNSISVYFPGRKTFLIKSLLLPASLSLLFGVIIMVTFAISIYYIIKQKKISEMKSDFINNMTHEFKTPLATIAVATDSIVNPKIIGNPERISNYASIIKKENQRMNKQVETILQIASLDRKDFDFKFKTTDIHELIDIAVQGIIFQIENRNGYINIEKNAQNPMVTTDPIHALNMLNNLLDNANKYSPDIPEITVTTRNSERGVWISVSDKGIGMNKQVQHKIFEKFYRETSGNIHNVKGFGLGLSYVKAIVDANKGEVQVISEPGKGSTFEVFLPFTLTS